MTNSLRQPPCHPHASANNSSTTSHIIRLSVSSPPALVFTECSHGSPIWPHIGLSPPTDPHIGIRKEPQPILNSLLTCTSLTVLRPSISPILQESPDAIYTYPHDYPTPLFPLPSFLAIRENKFGFSGQWNQDLNGGSSTLYPQHHQLQLILKLHNWFMSITRVQDCRRIYPLGG